MFLFFFFCWTFLWIDSIKTFFEDLSKEKYPNFSRLAQSWKNQVGYDYRFYLDSDIEAFLTTHFPPQVKEAYDALIPGAFKADLFRYCVLFIYGGVYADVDVMLESKLDMTIDNDVGFMIPLDSVSTIETSTGNIFGNAIHLIEFMQQYSQGKKSTNVCVSGMALWQHLLVIHYWPL